MGFFDTFSLLLASAFLFLSCQRQHISDIVRYRKALTYFVAALILFYPVSAIIMIGVYLSFVGHPLGMVLCVLSFRFLCQALLGQPPQARELSLMAS